MQKILRQIQEFVYVHYSIVDTLSNMKIADEKNTYSISTTSSSEFYGVKQFQVNTSDTPFSLYQNKSRVNPNEVTAIVDYMKRNFICGTGGYLLINRISLPQITINASLAFNVEHQKKKSEIKIVEENNEPIYDIGEILSVIRSSLSLNMKEMSEVIQVERQTVYSWMGGTSEPNPSNKKRINQIFQIAQRWKKISSKPIGELVRNSYTNGDNLVTMLSKENINQEDIFTFIEKLSEIVLKENTNKTSIRELVTRKGLKVQQSNETIDWLTGKRIDLE